MIKQLFSLLFCFVCFIKTEDQFWHSIENDLFKQVNLTNEKDRKLYANELMSRVKFLSLRLQDKTNQQRQKNIQEAIQALLNVYIYVEALTRYLKSENLREKLVGLEKRLLNAGGFIKQEELIRSEINQITEQLNNLYSQRALAELITITFKQFPFLSIHKDQIQTLAADIQNFIGNEIYFAKKSLSLNNEQIRNLYSYIQIAPLISDEYARQNGRFYLKALEEALNTTNTIVQIHLKRNENRYMVKQQELLKKLIRVTANDLLILNILL